MSRVHLAECACPERSTAEAPRLVVLKELDHSLQHEPAMRAALRLEAELSAGLNHPNVVRIFDVLECEASPVLVLEYLDGLPLSQVLRRTRYGLPLALHLRVLIEMLSGLHAFHELESRSGVRLRPVHRDVSPQNTFVLHDGAVKLLDFGIAKVPASQMPTTSTGLFKGKIQYMPPEQLFGERDIDRRADVFAAGIMLWEAVAKRRMWSKASVSQIAKAIASGALPDIRAAAPGAPACLVEIVERATQHDKSQRFTSALAMRNALESALAELYTNAAERTGSHAIAEFMRHNFESARAERQRSIQSYLRQPAPPEGYVAAAPTPEPCSYDVLKVPEQLAPTPPRGGMERRGLWMALTVLGLGIGLGAYWGLARIPARASQLSIEAAQPSVGLWITASPAAASLKIEGNPLPSNPFNGRLPREPREVSLEVSAPGHRTERRTLRLDQDTSISVSLEREGTSRPGLSSEAKGNRLQRNRSSVIAGASAGRTAAERKGARAAIAACSPPFYFAEDGSKIHRAECLQRSQQ